MFQFAEINFLLDKKKISYTEIQLHIKSPSWLINLQLLSIYDKYILVF